VPVKRNKFLGKININAARFYMYSEMMHLKYACFIFSSEEG